MKRVLAVSLFSAGALAIVAIAEGQAPVEVPFPAPKADVVVYGETVTAVDSSAGPAGAKTNSFARGSTVVFRAYAGDVKTKKILTGKDVTYFYVAIPGLPNIKLAYGQVGGTFMWTGNWWVPADYPLGIVPFRMLVKTVTKRFGSFVQTPVLTTMLTVRA